VATLLVDAADSTGGQIYARAPGTTWDAGLPPAVVAGARADLLDVRLGTAAWGAFGDRVALVTGERTRLTQPAAIVLATGAIERPVPFPGWDRPGVAAPGALQRLLKVAQVVPNGPIVLAGSGPFLFAVGADLRRAGADVRAIVERRTRRQLIGLVPALARRADRLREAAGFGRTLRGVQLRFGVDVVAVDDSTVALSDGSRIEADVVAAGYGFAPRLELARLLGLAVTEGAVAVDASLTTSRTGVFAAGETTGIGGAPLAAIEGRLAGLAAAAFLGRPVDEARRGRLHATRDAHLRFAQALARAYPPVPVLGAATPETTICRCEHISLGALRRSFSQPLATDDPRAAKAELRCAMGACQGVICGEAIRSAIGFAGPEGDRRGPRARPPAMPVTVGAVAACDSTWAG
jgi:NADPH-dependent 2,4-dienoyl-CoA reductase/sulfur reductase-like enzyme